MLQPVHGRPSGGGRSPDRPIPAISIGESAFGRPQQTGKWTGNRTASGDGQRPAFSSHMRNLVRPLDNGRLHAMSENRREYLLLDEVAREYRAPVASVRYWIARGRLRSIPPGRRRLVSRGEDLRGVLNAGARSTVSDCSSVCWRGPRTAAVSRIRSGRDCGDRAATRHADGSLDRH